MDDFRNPSSDHNKDSNLSHAVFQGDVDKAARILRNGWNVQTRSVNGHSVIHSAVRNNQLSMVRLLIDFGVNVNEMLEHLMTPMHVAARFSCGTVTKLLLENGADPNTASEWGAPLVVAAHYNNIEVAQMLLKGGATVSTQCLCNHRHANHSIMLLRAKLHIWAKEFIQLNIGFKHIFLRRCSRTDTSLGSLYGNIDVLTMIGRCLNVASTAVVDRVRQAVFLMELVEWENCDEQGFH